MITVSEWNTTHVSGKTKQWAEYVTCDKTEECPLYKEGKCACARRIIGRNLTCPNGKWNYLKGYTSRSAKGYYKFATTVEENYKPTAKSQKEKIATVAGYVYIPVSFLTGARNEFDGVTNDRFFPIDEFNEDLVERLVKFTPMTWFDYAPISKYKEVELPKFMKQLKEEMPDLYKKWEKKYPDSALKFKDLSNVGRTAYISTMLDGAICNGWVKDGSCLKNDKLKDYFFSGKFNSKQDLVVQVKIAPDMVAKVDSDDFVNGYTKYVD